LAARAQAVGTILLLGHGFMNLLIAGALRRREWKGPQIPSWRHWGYAVYDRDAV
jgi:hypothetical protein